MFLQVWKYIKYFLDTLYDDNAASEMQRMRKTGAANMKNEAFNGKDLISIPTYLTEFKGPYDSLGIHEKSAVCIMRSFMSDLSLVAARRRLT